MHDNATQTFMESTDSLGPSAVVRVGGIQVVLNSHRTQVSDGTAYLYHGTSTKSADMFYNRFKMNCGAHRALY